jgi:hypothetical protein
LYLPVMNLYSKCTWPSCLACLASLTT